MKKSKNDDVEFRNFVYGSTKKKCGGISLPFRSLVTKNEHVNDNNDNDNDNNNNNNNNININISNSDNDSSINVKPAGIKSSSNEKEKMELLDSFLENDKNRNLKDNWSKLDRSTKNIKINDFITLYSQTHHLSSINEVQLACFLKDCLINKRLHRIKDVVYDKKEGILSDIPGLYFNEDHQQFYLKHNITTTKKTSVKCESTFKDENMSI